MGFFLDWPNQHKRMKKNGETLQHLNIAEHISDLIFCKKVYTCDVDV